MYVKILYDNGARRGLVSGWGFSCLIDGKYIFDTGEAASSLMENREKMMVQMEDIEAIVISHDHYDHTGGLWEVLKRKKGIKVYVPAFFSETFIECVKESGGELIVVDKPIGLTDNIILTGGIRGTYKNEDILEQAAIVKGDKGVSVITGCAHPGIVKIIRYIKRIVRTDTFYMVFGGFHLNKMPREKVEKVAGALKKIGIKKIGPTHCTGEMAKRIIKSRFKKDYIPVNAGHIIQL